jgi:hypothetical protein
MKAEQLLEIEGALTASMAADRRLVEVRGRWLRRGRRVRVPAVLVVEHDKRQHRFPERQPPLDGRRPRAGASWSASFVVPTWLEPHLEGRTRLKLAGLTQALPAGSFARDEAPVREKDPTREEAPPVGSLAREEAPVREEATPAALLEAQELLAQARELRARLQMHQA